MSKEFARVLGPSYHFENHEHISLIFIILAVCKNLTQIENVSQNIVHAEIKCPHDHLAYCFLTNDISILTIMFVYTIGYIILPK